jgi:hypothetical protein
MIRWVDTPLLMVVEVSELHDLCISVLYRAKPLIGTDNSTMMVWDGSEVTVTYDGLVRYWMLPPPARRRYIDDSGTRRLYIVSIERYWAIAHMRIYPCVHYWHSSFLMSKCCVPGFYILRSNRLFGCASLSVTEGWNYDIYYSKLAWLWCGYLR